MDVNLTLSTDSSDGPESPSAAGRVQRRSSVVQIQQGAEAVSPSTAGRVQRRSSIVQIQQCAEAKSGVPAAGRRRFSVMDVASTMRNRRTTIVSNFNPFGADHKGGLAEDAEPVRSYSVFGTGARVTNSRASVVNHVAMSRLSFSMIGRDLNPFGAPAAEDEDDASVVESDDDENVAALPTVGRRMTVVDLRGSIVELPELLPLESPKKSKGEPSDEKKKEDVSRSVISAGFECVKLVTSVALVIFSVVIVMAAIFSGQTGAASYGIPPWVACVVFWALIMWLAAMEGGQGCLVGLQPVDRGAYSISHPKTAKNTTMVHRGDNMERFIVGRQFLVVLVVFLVNTMGAAVPGANVLGLPEGLSSVFLGSGLAMILTTIVLGQLTSQVNAATCMLDFINSYFVLYFITYASLIVEFSGLLHSVYLVQMLFSALTGNPIETNEKARNKVQNLFFWGRALMSLVILCFALAITIEALVAKKTTMWAGVPEWLSIVILFLLMGFVGITEGMQIAFFAVLNMPEEELAKHPVAHANADLTFRGQNLQAFLIGRQMLSASGMFVVARIMTLSYNEGETVFGFSEGFQTFLNTGLLNAVVTTIVASLMWRIIASSFPVAFLSNPIINGIIRLCFLLDSLGVCSASWVFARWIKILVGYQPDEVHLEDAKRHTSDPVTRRDRDVDRSITTIKYIASMTLLAFSVVIVMCLIFTGKTGAASFGIPAWASFLIFWFLIFWLAMMEGGQACVNGLSPIDQEEYAKSHPKTLKNTATAHKGDNMERFIVGRQFLTVLVIFAINLMGAAIQGAEVLGLPEGVTSVFLGSGLAMILTTIMLGQLTLQVNAASCMLDFINNYFMLYFVTYLSLLVEFLGLLHSVYLFQMLVSKMSGESIKGKEAPRNFQQNIFFWGRVLMSLVILYFAFAVTLKALFEERTTMWKGVPGWVSVVILFVLMIIVGIMEGIQNALFAVVNMPEAFLKSHTIAYTNSQLAFRGQNLKAFLIGRQICAASGMFIIARIMTLSYSGGETVFGFSESFQSFLNTGLLGAVITTTVASLIWRILALSFPITFLSNPIIYIIIRLCLLLDSVGICSAVWVLARIHKLLTGCQPDKVYLEGAERHTSAPATKRDKDIDTTLTVIKYVASTGLLIFSVVIVMATISTRSTQLSDSVNPVFAGVSFFILLLWLAIMEGGQGCLVGLQPVNKDLYGLSHPKTLTNASIVHKGDNMGRFIVGRQFLVVLVVTLINMCGSPSPSTQVLGLPQGVLAVFVDSGFAMIIATIVLGQLTSQVNAANCMLDFINNYFVQYCVIYMSLLVEFSGLLHSVYFVQILFSKITGQQIESKEPSRSILSSTFFWGRILMSLAILAFALAVTFTALFAEKTTMWKGIPGWVSVLILLLLFCFVGMLEGMQIALFTVANLPAEKLKMHKIVHANCELVFRNQNFQAFLIGRQILAATGMFVVARIMTLNYDNNDSVFGFSQSFQGFLNTGLLGAVITTILASLIWRVLASSFPIAFLSNPIIYIIIRICLILDQIGVCSSAWLLALINKQIMGFQIDDVYIGNPEEKLPEP
uniref:Uncharacterized protein n=1 Tax=Corethron hystrix TaxID=216773 RepID=A0A7S1BJG6_9STRA|mmetsp:Transcript_28576/g.65337  ORF Transcript_28576/g.65337 Transcript_28576/m.65337 type:complete len:1560 (+) Transcript_28576:345-5024(+)